ncbi:MAG: glycosyltransferase family 4 protein [Ardenticatenaceae bacterium]|nr:glycosyltransferase family 4 protein [Anaerolineales bacterium]MCB8940802.1 glycosyltransferase family 4 protein [Ardenticatenaceae bacterium]MCB8972141.1 glycosyltransferase family 4 protein [Ardenticatenaceae bacterium]
MTGLTETAPTETAVSTPTNLRVAYVMQNVGVDLAAEVGQMMLIRQTIQGLEQRGHTVDLLNLQGRDVVAYANLADLREQWRLALGWSGKRPYQLFEGALRRVHGALKLPYLAGFDSRRFYEACLRALPNYQICHEYAGLLSVGAAYASQKTNTPFVLTVDADLLLEADVMGNPITGTRRRAAQWAASKSYALADQIVTVSDPTRENLIENWGVPAEKIKVIPNGVNVAHFQQPVDTAQVRAEFGVTDAPVIMFVGGFQMWHGLDKLLEAMALVINVLPEARLLLVGDGPARPFVEENIYRLNLEKQVTITGFLPHARIPQLLAVADVVTVPYPKLPQEMWFSPLKLYEYMAAGKAIVASSAGQIKNVIRHNENGLLVTPGVVADLADACLHLLQNQADRTRLGQAAQHEAETEHAWSRQIERLELVYEAALGDR